jgi:hypothetical protein
VLGCPPEPTRDAERVPTFRDPLGSRHPTIHTFTQGAGQKSENIEAAVMRRFRAKKIL